MNWTVVAPATLGWRKFNEPLVGRENSTRARLPARLVVV